MTRSLEELELALADRDAIVGLLLRELRERDARIRELEETIGRLRNPLDLDVHVAVEFRVAGQ